MAIKSIKTEQTGLAGVEPRPVYIETDDDVGTILKSGFLNPALEQGFDFSDNQLALIKTADFGVDWYKVKRTPNNVDLVKGIGPGVVTSFDVTFTSDDLASASSKVLWSAASNEKYKLRQLFLNSGGTNFSGGSGDRDATITDGTTDYSVIPAGTLQSLVNARWGTGIPFPASASINQSTAAGSNLIIQYSGGTSDYTSGSATITGLIEKVAG